MSHKTARRVGQGRALRAAMAAKDDGKGWTIQQVADATTGVDPHGKGVSWQLVSFLTTTKRHARETTSLRTAALIEDALDAPSGSLFTVETVYAKTDRVPSFEDL